MLKVAHCHYCKAEIDWDALKCRHCGEWTGDPKTTRASGPAPAHPPAMDQPVTQFVPASDFASDAPSLVGWFASAALAGGVFLPFVSMPLIGGISFWNLRGDGAFVLGAGLVAMLAHWRQWRTVMLAAALPGTGLVAWDVIRLLRELGNAGGFVGLGFGAFVMLAGGIAAVVAAWRMDR